MPAGIAPYVRKPSLGRKALEELRQTLEEHRKELELTSDRRNWEGGRIER